MEEITIKSRKNTKRRKIKHFSLGLILCIVYIGIFATLTNPFARLSIVRNSFVLTQKDGQFHYQQIHSLQVQDNMIAHTIANLKSGWHIIASRMRGGGKPAEGNTVESV